MSEKAGDVVLNLLVIDDDEKVLAAIGKFLRGRGHGVVLADGGRNGIERLSERSFDVVITDVRMPDVDGFEVLRHVRETAPGTETIIITAYRDIESAFRAMREGAFDFFTKPFRVADLDASLRRTLRFRRLWKEKLRAERRLSQVGAQVRAQFGLHQILGSSPGIEAVREMIRKVAATPDGSVLIAGETGTGKELVARAIHAESDRAACPFVAVDCSAVSASLAESEFMGHVKGAFTDARDDHRGHFQAADGGTLFLDEVSEMSLQMQAKLLRSLEEKRVRPVGSEREVEVDVRVVSATNRDLRQAAQDGTFRRDLYYRLNAFTIEVPPLRERRQDIEVLAGHFLAGFAGSLGKRIEGFLPDTLQVLLGHPFDGNIRELRNAVERAAALCNGTVIGTEDLRLPVTGTAASVDATPSEKADTTNSLAGLVSGLKDLRLDAIERAAIQEALSRSAGNRAAAARMLGLSRSALRRRLARLGLDGRQ